MVDLWIDEVDLIDGEVYGIGEDGPWYLYIDGAMRKLSHEESVLMFERLDEVLH